MNTILKRIVALVLCLVMTAGYIPVNAFADETGETVAAAAAEVTTEPSVVETAEETAADTTEETEPEKPGKPEKSGKHEKNKNNGKGKKSGQETTPVTETTVPVTEETVPVTSEATEPSTEATEPTVIAVTGITLDQTALEVGVGELPMSLTATVQPEDATDKTVTWTSSEPGVAFVDENGTLTFGYMGEATITATAGEFSATCVVTVGEGEWDTYEGGTVVIAGSDYQQKGTAPKTNTESILEAIQGDYTTAYGFLFGGDYYQDTLDTTTKSKEGKTELDNAITSAYPNLENRVYIQGNHDNDSLVTDGTLSATGAHDTDYYGVYAINEKDYPWGWQASSSFQSTCQNTANALDAYLDAKADTGYTKPIFVITHVPLHFSPRTSSMGDGKYAKYLYDVLDEAGGKGLNIIFLFGHNHSNTYDDYIGGGQIYLAKGSTIAIANEGSTTYFTDELTFTYMNCGYVGYIGGKAGTNLSMSVFEIQDDEVIVKRYGTNGLVQLKAAGVTTSGAPTADTSVVESGAVIELGEPEEKVEQTDNNVTVSAPGLTGLTVVKKDVTHDQETYSAYASYDITLQGYEQGKTATVTITLDEADGFDASRKVIVIDVEKNTETEKSIEGGKVTFTTDHFSTYNIAQKAVPVSSGYTYELVTSIEPGEKYVIVGNDDDVALMDDNGSFGSQTVTISGTTLTSDVALTEWTISATSGGTIVSDQGNGLSYSSKSFNLTGAADNTFNITAVNNNFTILTVRTNSGYSKYYFNYDGSGWTSKPTSTEYVRLYKLIGTGSGGGSTVTPEGGNWVTISSGVGGTIYTLTDTLEAGKEYLIVSANSGSGYALQNPGVSSGSVAMGATAVDIQSGTTAYITTDATDIVWTATDNGSVIKLINNNNYLEGKDGGVKIYSASQYTNRGWKYESNQLKYTGGSNTYIVYYDKGYTYTYGSTSNKVYLFAKTGTESAGDAEYAKLDGELTYTLERGLKDDAALAVVMNGIDVVVSGDKTNENTLTDDNTDIKWELASNYDGNIPGEYAVEIYYKEKLLGTAKVIVPEATIVDYSCDNAGAVNKGASKNAETGAYITVDVKDDEGADYRVPVTVGMLTDANGNKVSTSTVGTITDLYVNYNDRTFPFTLTINPKEGNNYPNYPDPGAVKVNKTATGIDFQASGIATVELSASGIPMNEGVDVVIILDASSSMESDHADKFPAEDGTEMYRMELLRPAVNNLIEQLKTKREDGSNPDVDIAIATFNGNTLKSGSNYIGSTTSGTGTNYGVKTGDGTITGAWEDINTISATWATDNNNANTPAGSGTNYDYGLQLAYDLLAQKKADSNAERLQFVMFLSDGAPSQYNGVSSNDGEEEYVNWIRGNYNETDENTSNDIPDTVTEKNKAFYTGFNNNNGQLHRSAEAIKAAQGETRSILRFTTDTTGQLEEVDGLGATIYSIGLLLEDGSARTEEDQITVLKTIASDDSKFFNIDSVNDLRGAFTSFAQEVLLAATNARFEDQMGEMYDLQLTPVDYLPTGEATNYSTINPQIEVRSYEIYTRAELEADGTFSDEDAKLVGTRKTNTDGTYKYTTLETVTFQYSEEGTAPKKYTLTGATSDQLGSTNILNNGVVCAENFYYNTTSEAVTVDGITVGAETFYWKLGDIKTTELAIRYNVYLTGSLQGKREAGSYDTNEGAVLYYNNYLGNACKKETVSPTLAWKGANVRYAFYLVDTSSGKPVNNEGVEIPFTQRVVIVNPTECANINLNSSDAVESREIVAEHILPEGYWLYDESAMYKITVNGNGTGEWDITGDSTLKNPYTTYVTDYDGNKYTYEDSNSEIHPEHDYTHTTVWFAVKWEPRAMADTVVVDYGLPVDVHVLTNDMFGKYGKLIGVAKGDITETASETENSAAAVSVEGDFGTAEARVPATGYTEANSVIRYAIEDMQMTAPDVFTYSIQYANPVESKNDGFYYGTLTVIPATTIYYEDTFLDLDSYSKNTDGDWDKDENTELYGNDGKWAPVGTAADATQDEDRPGDINFAFDTLIDANNVYGNDSAYETMSTYSLGSAAKVTVDNDSYATATFTFCGTGFDVISLTSNTTGTITVKVTNADTGANVKNLIVDTYYGLDPNGNVVEHGEENALYQVPVMKYGNMPYGKYEVLITAAYNDFFNHNDAADSYDLYIDAIRIYDPTGNQNDVANNAYAADGEGWPVYEELRNNIIAAADFTVENGAANAELPGLVFIDSDAETASVADYVSYGPNNELYLARGQAIVFNLNLEDKAVAKVQLGMKSATGDEVSYVIADGSQITKAEDLTGASKTVLKTATDMYYDITEMKDKTIVIYNAGESGILSLTNIKVTFDEAPVESQTLFYVNTKQIEKVLKNINTVEPDDTVSDDVVTEITPGTDSTTGEIPGMTIAVPETVTVGTEFEVRVETTSEVTSVTINDVKANTTDSLTWTATLTAADTETMEVEAVASYTVTQMDEETETEVETTKTVSVSANVKVAPSVTVTLPEFQKIGSKYVVSVKTRNADEVTVNGNAATFKGDVWSYEVTAGGTAGEEAVKVIAKNAVATTTVETSVTLYSAQIEVDKVTVKANEAIAVKITTSSNVEKVTVNGKVIVSYTLSEGSRIWRTETSFKDTGNQKLTVNVYDAEGHEDTAESRDITVSKATEGEQVQETVKKIIGSIVAQLKKWFNW